MTGTRSEFEDSVKVLLPPGPRCRLLCKAVEYLLSSEYVVSKLVAGRVFRVVRGPVMGHRHSGCIVDCSFFALGDREFAAKSQVLQSFGIKRYNRYRDDVFMICSRKQGTREFFVMLRGKVQPFKLQAEEVSRSSIRYQDLLLTKTGTRFVARPAFKTTSLARPLDPTSTHPKFVHRSWQVGVVTRIFPLCRREADVLPCKEELISRLQANSASKCTIARIVKASPWPERKVPRGSDVSSVLWAVLISIRDLRGSCRTRFVVFWIPGRLGHCSQKSELRGRKPFHLHHTHVMRCMESVGGGVDGTV